MQKLPDFVPALSHHLKPMMRDGSQFTCMFFRPRIDGGIPLDSAVESQQIRSHRRSTFCSRDLWLCSTLRLCSTLNTRNERDGPSVMLQRVVRAKIGARVGTAHEKARPGGICLCIDRREDQGTWGLAREDARESARNHTRG